MSVSGFIKILLKLIFRFFIGWAFRGGVVIIIILAGTVFYYKVNLPALSDMLDAVSYTHLTLPTTPYV